MSESFSLVLTARGGAGQAVCGEALVSTHPFSPRYDLDRATGVISRIDHDLAGKSLANKIVVFPAAKGGVAAGWALYALKAAGLAPLAFVFTTVNPVFVQGAVHAGIPILHGISPDPVAVLATGMRVQADPAALTIRVLPPVHA